MTSLPRGALGAWWAEGARAAFGLRPRAALAAPEPLLVFALWLVPMLLALALERLYISGPAVFYAPSLLTRGWFGTVMLGAAAWLCAGASQRPIEVFARVCAASPTILLATTLVLLPTAREAIASGEAGNVTWGIWFAAMAYYYGATVHVLWRAAAAPRVNRVVAALVVVGAGAAQQAWMPVRAWYPQPQPATERAGPQPFLRQETFELQAQVLQRELDALPAQRPGVVDAYTITYAPDADEAVFARESAMVAGVMHDRFGAPAVQLVSQRETLPLHAWATPLNLQRAILRIARQMNRDEDVLFIHLTSHGGRDGRLATSFAPLETEPVTPALLKQWLDQAGVRWRIVSVSACYAGSWIAPLADAQTLIVTAADAEHTSYGCGRGSELTYFGRAMYDEALRRGTGFEAAHAQARRVIDERERSAGKDDGYSNPQIAIGAAMREQLPRLEATPR
jgi:hypothetical protein